MAALLGTASSTRTAPAPHAPATPAASEGPPIGDLDPLIAGTPPATSPTTSA